jgi:hypothetical protein
MKVIAGKVKKCPMTSTLMVGRKNAAAIQVTRALLHYFIFLPFLCCSRHRESSWPFPGRVVKSAISCTLALWILFAHTAAALQPRPGNLFISSGIAMCDKLYTHTHRECAQQESNTCSCCLI